MPRRRAQPEENPFAGLSSGSSLTPAAATDEAQHEAHDEDEFPAPPPNRANVLAALAIADDETDLDMANYYVQRAIGEALLLLFDQLAAGRDPQAGG